MGLFLLHRELFARVSVMPCTVGKWANSITSNTCCLWSRAC